MNDRRTDTLAGEYVLGSLPPDEHEEARRRLASDPAFVESVRAWERLLGPLAGRIPAVRPPLGTLTRILARLPMVRRRVMPAFSPMRVAAVLAVGVIAIMAIMALIQERRGGVLPILVAQLHAANGQSAGSLPAFAVAIDQGAHKLVVNPVNVEDHKGIRYSLWVVRPGDERPVTRARLSATDPTVLPWRAAADLSDLVGARVRISAGEDWTAPEPWSRSGSYFEGVLVRPANSSGRY